ncbi:MAG: hypothetical protein ACK5KR_03945 [Breznakia sp.]
MKKITITCIAITLVFLQACAYFDTNISLCNINSQKNITFQMRYRQAHIQDIERLENYDYRSLSDAEYKIKVNEMRKRVAIENKYKGIVSEMSDSDRLLMKTVSIDYDAYNLKGDPLSLFPFDVEEEAFQSAKTFYTMMREKGYACDELVSDQR